MKNPLYILFITFPSFILATSYGSVSYDSGNGDFDMAQMLTLLNQNRATSYLGPLVIDSRLITSASTYCQTMVSTNCFEHTCGPVPSFSDRITNAGFHWSSSAENIAEGQTSTSGVMTDWMNSPGHRANILNGAYTRVGLAFCQSYSTTYWVQDFAAEMYSTGETYVVKETSSNDPGNTYVAPKPVPKPAPTPNPISLPQPPPITDPLPKTIPKSAVEKTSTFTNPKSKPKCRPRPKTLYKRDDEQSIQSILQ